MAKKINSLIYNLDDVLLLVPILAVAIVSLKSDISNLGKNIDDNAPVLYFLCIITIVILHQYRKVGELKDLIVDPKNSVHFVEEIKGSKFEFQKMASQAKESIFIVGPNLAFLSKTDEWKKCQKILFDKLNENSQFKVRILIMDRRNKDICEFMCKDAFTTSFLSELDNSTMIFSRWLDEATEQKLENLEIYVTNILTFSLLFIDAGTDDGRVLVSPIPSKIHGNRRPSFVIEKRHHKDSFKKYYDYCYDLYKKAKDFKDPDLRHTKKIGFAFSEMPETLKEDILLDYGLLEEYKQKKDKEHHR